MKQKTVILWGHNDLLTRAIEMLFRAGEKDAWQVIRCPESECLSALVEQVQKDTPDLVILNTSKPADSSDPLMRLFAEQPELKVIADQPESRVITISLERNEMQVYSKHTVMVRHVSDLMSLIEQRNFLEYPVKQGGEYD